VPDDYCTGGERQLGGLRCQGLLSKDHSSAKQKLGLLLGQARPLVTGSAPRRWVTGLRTGPWRARVEEESGKTASEGKGGTE
jgi:hypothetical protein